VDLILDHQVCIHHLIIIITIEKIGLNQIKINYS